MDMEIYKDNLRNNEKLNDEIIQQFIKLRKECEEFNKEYAGLQKEYEALSEKNIRGTERLRQLMDEIEFLTRVGGSNAQKAKKRSWSLFSLLVIGVINFCFLFTLLKFAFKLKHERNESSDDNLGFII